MSAGFTKLFSSLTESTLWVEQPHHVRIVWITMLAMADKDGLVAASIPGLARRACVTVSECEEALKVFLAPDRYSRTPDHEGRRIKETMGGWELLNHARYRQMQSSEAERARKREYMRTYREEQKVGHSSLQVSPVTESGNGNESGSASASASASGSVSKSDPDPERAKPKPGSIVAPADMTMNATQLVRCQELRFDPEDILRDFKLQEFNRAYTDWPRRLSKWIEDEKVKRETENAKRMGAQRQHPVDRAIQRGVTELERIRAREAEEERRMT